MACWEGKQYKLETSDNLDEYMKAFGVSLVLRKIGNNISSTVELKRDGDTYSLAISTILKSTTITFKLGEEFEDEVDGRMIPTVFTLEGDKLTQELKGDKPTTIVREFTDTELITTLTIGDIVAVRTYLAV